MIAEQVTPATADTASDTGFTHRAGQAYGVIVAVGGIIMTINACCYLYDRMKDTKKTAAEKTADQVEVAKVWASENAKANADLFEAAVKVEAAKIMAPHIERIDALEQAGGKKPAKKATKKA